MSGPVHFPWRRLSQSPIWVVEACLPVKTLGFPGKWCVFNLSITVFYHVMVKTTLLSRTVTYAFLLSFWIFMTAF